MRSSAFTGTSPNIVPIPRNNRTTKTFPSIQGGAGTCSLDLTVLGGDGRPVHAATIKVHIAYGFGGLSKLDLEAGTNSDGKVKFAGLLLFFRPHFVVRSVGLMTRTTNPTTSSKWIRLPPIWQTEAKENPQ